MGMAMTGRIFLLALAVCLAGFACPAAGLGRTGAAGEPELRDFGFLAGAWRGSLGSSVIEEHWSAPEGDNMIGMFRIVRGGKAVMYEINVIEQTERGPVLRIRHYGAGLAPRDETLESTTFTLVDLTKNKATFEALDKHARLSYHRVSLTELTITLDKAGPGGKRSAMEFRFTIASGAERGSP